jgi:cell division protein FtsW
VNMQIGKHLDKVLISSSIVLIMLGIIFIYSSSGPFSRFLTPPRPSWHFMARQALWAAIGLTIMFAAYRLNYEFLVKISPVLLLLSIAGLIAVIPLSHANIKRWINVGGFTFQPSEYFKLAAIAFMARIAGKMAGGEKNYRKSLPGIGLLLLGTFLVLIEPDLGTATLIMAVLISLLFLIGFPKRHLALILVAGFGALVILVFGLKYEKDRVDSYLVTLKDPFSEGASYQTRQSLVSLGSGGLVGKGLANGGQKHLFLPARHTDFILSAAAEEGGFLIVMIILSLFGIVAWSGSRIAGAAVDIEGTVLSWGVMLFIILQGVVNIAVALGLFPITGITLPFLSYGGSSIVACCAAVGVAASVARRGRMPRRYFKRLKA